MAQLDKKMLIFVAGTKGGVGKSFATVMLASAAMDLGLSFKVYDTDDVNHTSSTLLKENAEFIGRKDEEDPLDDVIENINSADGAFLTIVDMKAGTSVATQDWWFSAVPWEVIMENFDIYILGSVTADIESGTTFLPWMNYFQDRNLPVNYLIVKNYMGGKNFSGYENTLEKHLKQSNSRYTEFSFCGIEQRYISELKNHNLSLRDHVKNADCGILSKLMQRSRLRNHYLEITDPLIVFLAGKAGSEQFTDEQRSIFSDALERIHFRKAADDKKP